MYPIGCIMIEVVAIFNDLLVMVALERSQMQMTRLTAATPSSRAAGRTTLCASILHVLFFNIVLFIPEYELDDVTPRSIFFGQLLFNKFATLS